MPVDIEPEPLGRMIDAAGVGYHVVEMGVGSPTVFLHGGGPGCTAWTDFGPVAPLFAADRRCYLVDLAQYGKSAKCLIAGPMWEWHARSIVALLDALGVEQADFVCNSWGGTIALKLAAEYPARAAASSSRGRCRSSTAPSPRSPKVAGAAASLATPTSVATGRPGRRCAI